ncbi:MAG: hypothetical protein ABI456_21845 [Ktedonobacteraceae bacterium]
MLAEELEVLDVDSPLWQAARPLLDAALRLEQNDETYTWHGWGRRQISTFLASLPALCSLVVGVWETMPAEAENAPFGSEELMLGVVCKVIEGEVQAICTFEALTAYRLKPIKQLEPGLDDALEIMRAARTQVAPVAWALFTDRETWNAWVFASDDAETVADKAQLLASFVRQGRCVLLGSSSASQRDV